MKTATNSQQYSGKNSASKYNCDEKFLKNLLFGVDVKLKVPPQMFKFNTHNMDGVRSYAVKLNKIL